MLGQLDILDTRLQLRERELHGQRLLGFHRGRLRLRLAQMARGSRDGWARPLVEVSTPLEDPVAPGSVLLEEHLRSRSDLATVSIGHQLVVVDRPHQQPHLLNSTASLVFGAADGRATVKEIIEDLAAVLDGDPERMASEVLELVRELRVRRLLVDAAIGSSEETASIAPLSEPLLPGWIDVVLPPVEVGATGRYLHFEQLGCLESIEAVELVATTGEPEWLDPFTVAVGGFHVGVRTNAAEVDELLRQLFCSWLVEDAAAPVSLSLYAGEPGEAGARHGLHALYEGFKRVASSVGLSYVVQSLDQRLASYDPGEGVLRFPNFAAVVGGRGAALVPRFATDPEQLRRRLRGAGLSFAPGSIMVDPVGMDLVVEELSDDPGPIREAERLSPGLPGDPGPVGRGRHPIVALGLTAARPFEPGTSLRPEEAVFLASQPGVTSIGLPDQERLELLARLATAESLFTCDATPKQLAGRLATLLA